MYRKKSRSLDNIENFELLPGTKLSSENRWVIIAELIPWEEFEEEYAKQFKMEKKKKPRTYRNIARKEYLRIAKKRCSTKKERREAIRKQLKYIEKNLVSIEKLILEGATLDSLNKRQRKLLGVVKKVHEQQLQMWEKETKSVPQRIVSITQPHIRPIVRGKAGKPTEFGAKLSISCIDDYIFLDRISWENYVTTIPTAFTARKIAINLN